MHTFNLLTFIVNLCAAPVKLELYHGVTNEDGSSSSVGGSIGNTELMPGSHTQAQTQTLGRMFGVTGGRQIYPSTTMRRH